MTTDEFDRLAELFKIFATPTRLQILSVLMDGEKCVFDIAEALQMSQSAISHQLGILKQNRLVKNRRDGKTVYYSLLDSHVLTIIEQGLNHIRE
jgi:ArsR family transcriptional regulator